MLPSARETLPAPRGLTGTALTGTALTGTALTGTALTGTALIGSALPGAALAAVAAIPRPARLLVGAPATPLHVGPSTA